MNKNNILVILPMMVVFALTGCDGKTVQAPSSPPSIEKAPPLIPAPLETPVPAETLANGLENTDAAGLGNVIKDYNAEVDASNDKAREVIDDYNKRISTANGNE